MTLTNAVGHTIRRLRREQHLSLREVKYVSLGHLSEIERGIKQASNEVLEVIALGLHITTAQLLKEIYEYLEEKN
jgi:hypothetical protein